MTWSQYNRARWLEAEIVFGSVRRVVVDQEERAHVRALAHLRNQQADRAERGAED